MGEPTFLEKIFEAFRNYVYKISLPVYLWSIGFRSLGSYVEELVQSETRIREMKILELVAENKKLMNTCIELNREINDLKLQNLSVSEQCKYK